MSDMVRAWLDHTHRLDSEATEGPWAAWTDQDGQPHMNHMLMVGNAAAVIPEGETWIEGVDVNPVAHTYTPEDRKWIAHARTALPAATAALRAVLDQHQQADYQRHVPRMLRRTPEDHLPYRPCDGCREEWPCPTVKAMTAALTSHQHPTPLGSSGKCGHEARGITWAEGNTTCYVCATCEHEWAEER